MEKNHQYKVGDRVVVCNNRHSITKYGALGIITSVEDVVVRCIFPLYCDNLPVYMNSIVHENVFNSPLYKALQEDIRG